MEYQLVKTVEYSFAKIQPFDEMLVIIGDSR